jgi:hypothetical protein
MFRGYYDQSNYTKASALILYNASVGYPCTTQLGFTGYFSFGVGSLSNTVQLFDSGGHFTGFTQTLFLDTLQSGYWTQSFGGVYESFTPGDYTVITADEWGQMILLHFTVEAGTHTTTRSTTQVAGSTTSFSISNIQPSNFSVTIWTNSSASIISNASLLAYPPPPPQIIRFYVGTPSYIFARPSFGIVPGSNGSVFTINFQNGTSVPSVLNKTQNVMGTREPVSGWIEINAWWP